MKKKHGFSLIDISVTLALMLIIMTVAMPNWNKLQDKSKDSAVNLVGHFKKIRSKALSTTRAYKISATSPSTIIAQYASTCSATTWTTDSSLTFNLASQSSLQTTNWSVCYDSTGLSQSTVMFTLHQYGYSSRNIQIVLGGAVRYI